MKNDNGNTNLATNESAQAIEGKILLVLMPFWSPLIPPMGIACLKSFMRDHGYDVKNVDVNNESHLRELYHSYFETMARYIPKEKQGNFYSIGQDVLRNHLMAHYNKTDEDQYNELVETLVYQSFFSDISRDLVAELNGIVETFFTRLEDYFLDLLKKEQPAVLGFSLYNGTLPATYCALKLTKKHFPHIKTVLGGGIFADQLAEGSPNMDFFLEKTKDCVDYVIIGEGEHMFLKLMRGQLPTGKKVFSLKDIGWQTLDIHKASLPDFQDFNLEFYPNFASYTSRSCPFQCSFCSETVQWGRYRKKSGKQIVDELTSLHHRFGEQLFYMSDSLLNPVLNGLAEEFIKSDLALYWDGPLRADKHICDQESALKWRRGGYYRARIGMESASQRVLNLMGKKITVAQMRDAMASLAHAGIKTSTLWLIGHPGETEADFQETLDFIEEYRDYFYDAEPTPFWYHLKGQSNSDEWYKAESVLLYPETAADALITQTWVLDCEPSREVIYDRLNRFVAHIRRLGIPNPYTLQEIHAADVRWQKLQKNAVPSLVDLKNKELYIDECKGIKEASTIKSPIIHDGNWGF